MKKYRVKLSDERIVGPLNSSDINTLLNENKINEDSAMQEFPNGDWKAVSDFKKDLDQQDATFIRKLSDFSLEKPELENIKEEVVEESVENFPEEFKFEKKEEAPAFLEGQTVIRKIENITGNDDKTQINPDTLKYLEELKKEKEKEKIKEEEKAPEEVVEEEVIDYKNDATQFISLDELQENVADKIIESELFLEKEKREKEEKEKIEEDDLIDKAEETKALKPKKKKSLVAVIALIAIAFLLFDDEEEVQKNIKINVVAPKISFPQQFEVIDEKKAVTYYRKGLELLQKNDYLGKVKASKAFRLSVEHKFRENPSMGKLIYYYSELLKNSNTKTTDATKIFKLIQIFKANAIKDAQYASALALFYYQIEKFKAAENVVDRFLAIEKNKPTLELFGIYLSSLQKGDNVEKGNKVLNKLLSVSKRPLDVNIRILSYLSFIGDTSRYKELLASSIKQYKNSVALLLLIAKQYIEQEEPKKLERTLKRIQQLKAENSKVYYAKYLEYKGILSVFKNDFKRANGYFKKALKYNESSELRSRLASLDLSQDPVANQLISESKAIKLIQRSKKHFKNKNTKNAFKDALDAVNIAPNYIPASLNLARLQVESGLFKEAIALLEKLQDKKVSDPEITFALINAYTLAYKLSEVKKLLAIISSSSLVQNYRYFKATAKYYLHKKDFINSVNWLQLTIKKNPLDEEVLSEMANILIEYRKYNKAKVFLSKLIDLNPVNFKYRIMYADILFESEGSDSAIGYIYDILKFYPEEPELLSAIGIYYYRSGQQKKYKNILEELEKLPNQDYSLYTFLIKSAQLDNDNKQIIENANKLLNEKPGDLKTRMLLGKTYMEEEKYEDALKQFKKVEERLDSYPQLQYFMSRLFLLTDNVDKAIELAKVEVKTNPHSINGHVLLGDIYRKQKEFLNAEKSYKRAQKIDEKNVPTLIGLASINVKRSHYDIAIDLLKKAREIEPANSSIHKLLGDAFRKIGQSALAVESYKIFLELSPNSRYKGEIETYMRLMQ